MHLDYQTILEMRFALSKNLAVLGSFCLNTKETDIFKIMSDLRCGNVIAAVCPQCQFQVALVVS